MRGHPSVPLALFAAILAGCGSSPILANAPRPQPTTRAAATVSPGPPDPRALKLPKDDGPHDRLTEWWYYTGHLRDADGGRWGFEFVVFRAERGGFPVSWASHLALTDETGDAFHYAQRSEVGPHVARVPEPPRQFAFALTGFDPADPATAGRPLWQMAGGDGHDQLAADASPAETQGDAVQGGFGLTLRLDARKPAAFHDGDGWVDFGPAGGSYYYSRTDMAVVGELRVGDRRLGVEGSAWFDHQWGDFISVGGGGWDWFAVELADGRDITVSRVRAADGSFPLVYGTLVGRDGSTTHLVREDFNVAVTDSWTSPATGARYPAGWTLAIPGQDLMIDLTPTVAQQELDTRATTGVTYWEGSQRVSARQGTTMIGGEAYVELTGYGPSG